MKTGVHYVSTPKQLNVIFGCKNDNLNIRNRDIFLVSGLKHKLWLLFRINAGSQQTVTCCSKLTMLLVNVSLKL